MSDKMTVKELEEEYGEADYIYLTEESLKELNNSNPIHCGDVILIPKNKS